MNRFSILVGIGSVLLLMACSRKLSSSYPGDFPQSDIPARSVLYLSEVECVGTSHCNAQDLQQLWQSCLEKGYTQKRPSSGIVSSRQLREKNQITYSVRVNTEESTEVEKIIPPGIVVKEDGPVKIKTETRSRSVHGSCVGSEYLVK